jgi:hypothetical protein
MHNKLHNPLPHIHTLYPTHPCLVLPACTLSTSPVVQERKQTAFEGKKGVFIGSNSFKKVDQKGRQVPQKSQPPGKEEEAMWQ